LNATFVAEVLDCLALQIVRASDAQVYFGCPIFSQALCESATLNPTLPSRRKITATFDVNP
jgi:hypothetical protein